MSIDVQRAETAMNERSSRAHSVVVLSLEQVMIQTGEKVSSKLFLADLGGSEQVLRSCYCVRSSDTLLFGV